MRKLLFLASLSLLVTACSDESLPTNVSGTAPTIQAYVGTLDEGTLLDVDMCGGLSPCDAFDYGHSANLPATTSPTGTPGFCFLPPSVAFLSYTSFSTILIPYLGASFSICVFPA